MELIANNVIDELKTGMPRLAAYLGYKGTILKYAQDTLLTDHLGLVNAGLPNIASACAPTVSQRRISKPLTQFEYTEADGCPKSDGTPEVQMEVRHFVLSCLARAGFMRAPSRRSGHLHVQLLESLVASGEVPTAVIDGLW